MRIFLDTYGCTFNRSDSEAIRGILAGHEFTGLPKAQAVIVNSCGVKLPTESKIAGKVREYLAAGKRVIVAGCLPAINPKAFEGLDVSLVDSNSLARLPEALEGKEPVVFGSPTHIDKLSLPRRNEGITAIVPIAEGCLGRCAYCGTKNARGNLTSYPVDAIECFVRRAIKEGKKEILLTAQDCGCYGLDISKDAAELLERIAAIDGDFCVRLGMANPDHVLPMLGRLLRAYQNPKIYRFLHVPVQSGSDRVLRAMGRPYKTADFCRIVARFRKEISDIAISTDIIVGFPGETDADFQKMLALVRKTRPDITNISKFYPRPRTPAARMRKLPTELVKRRSVELSALCRRISLEQNRRYVGRTMRCLVVGRSKAGQLLSRAPNYKQVILPSGSARPGTFAQVCINGAGQGCLTGIIVK